MTTNRLASAPGRARLIADAVSLVDAVARRDRWAIARRATGPPLSDLLAGSYDSSFGAAFEPPSSASLSGAPVVLMDDGVAVVNASATGTSPTVPLAVTALLVQSEAADLRWLGASLRRDEVLDNTFQRRVQHEKSN